MSARASLVIVLTRCSLAATRICSLHTAHPRKLVQELCFSTPHKSAARGMLLAVVHRTRRFSPPLDAVHFSAAARTARSDCRPDPQSGSACRQDRLPLIAEVQPSSLQRLNERLCELLDASIELQSAPGQGTTFRVIFPRRYLSVTT
jgi:hypothetical protein